MAGFSLVPGCLIDRQSEKCIGEMIRRNCLCGSPSDQLCLVPLNPIAASDLLSIKLLPNPWSDPKFRFIPEAIHFSGEVFGELG